MLSGWLKMCAYRVRLALRFLSRAFKMSAQGHPPHHAKHIGSGAAAYMWIVYTNFLKNKSGIGNGGYGITCWTQSSPAE